MGLLAGEGHRGAGGIHRRVGVVLRQAIEQLPRLDVVAKDGRRAYQAEAGGKRSAVVAGGFQRHLDPGYLVVGPHVAAVDEEGLGEMGNSVVAELGGVGGVDEVDGLIRGPGPAGGVLQPPAGDARPVPVIVHPQGVEIAASPPPTG